MEPHDLLADKMHIGRPVFLHIVVLVVFVAQRRHVVEQSVHPDINHVLGIKIHRNAPGKAGTGNAQVLQALIDKGLHLIHAGSRRQEFGVLVIQLQQPVGILGKPEKVCLLFSIYHRASAVGAAAVLQLALGPEALAGGAVFSFIGALINISAVVKLTEDLLDRLYMVVVGGADKAVIADVHQLPQRLKAAFPLYDLIHILLRGHAGSLCLVLDLLSVLVCAGQEHHIVALQPFVTCHAVGGNGAVAVPDMQLIRWIVDGCGDIKLFPFHFITSCANERNFSSSVDYTTLRRQSKGFLRIQLQKSENIAVFRWIGAWLSLVCVLPGKQRPAAA